MVRQEALCELHSETLSLRTNKPSVVASVTAQEVDTLAPQPGDLSSIPRAHREVKIESCTTAASDVHLHRAAHALTHPHNSDFKSNITPEVSG